MPKRSKNNWKIHLFVTLAVIIIGLILYHSNNPFVKNIALGFDDYKLQMRQLFGLEPIANNDVVIVAIDEKSVNELGRWPWDRKNIAAIFAALNEARIVGVDLVFSEKTNEASDAQLNEVIAENDNMILGYFLRSEATSENAENNFDILEECAFHNIEMSNRFTAIPDFPYVETNLIPFHENSLSCGFFSAKPDADGLYRQYPIAYVYQGLLLPSLAVQVVRYLEKEDARILLDKKGIKQFVLGDNVIHNKNNIRLNFSKNISSVSAVDVFSQAISPAYFKDKIVLVGVTEMGVFDMRPTPVDSITPGVHLHFTAISNLLDNNILYDSKITDILLIILSVILVSIFSTWRRMSIRLIFYLVTFFSIIIIANTVFYQFNIWLLEFYALLALLTAASLHELLSFNQLGHEAKELKQAFSSYVSPELVAEITRDPNKLLLGGDEKNITVLFSDIRNFTSMSEKLNPTELVTLLNELFDPLTAVVLENKGMLDKYIGDAMMVLFNAPLDLQDHPLKAVKTGIAMLHILDDVNTKLQSSGLPEVRIGIGINTGTAVVGNMGSKVRFNYTALGDAVNLASRLEGLTKYYGVKIIISEFTREQVKNESEILLRKLDRVKVKGKDKTVTIYEVMQNNEKNALIKARFEQALDLYFCREFIKAATQFQELYQCSNDSASQIFNERCLSYQQQPPSSDWQGAEMMQSK